MRIRNKFVAALVATTVCLPLSGQAKTLRWATQGDILTLDPHSQNELLVLNAAAHVYDALLAFDIHAREFGHIPLHHQMAPWAMAKNVHVKHRVDNMLIAHTVRID